MLAMLFCPIKALGNEGLSLLWFLKSTGGYCFRLCLSICLSVMLSPSKPLDRTQPKLLRILLTQVGHAMAHLFWPPTQGACGGVKEYRYMEICDGTPSIEQFRFFLISEKINNACITNDFFDLILYVPSTIFQLYRDRSSWVEPVLS